MKLYSNDPTKRRKVFVGEYNATTGVFTKPVKRHHFMKKYVGYGISKNIVDYLDKQGCKTVRIIFDTLTFDSDFSKWTGSKAVTDEYGHGQQVFLNINEMGMIT